jgi:hypothetical protein
MAAGVKKIIFAHHKKKTHSIYCLNAVSLDAMRFIRGKNDF